MPNHPNRGPKGPSSNPAPAEIRAAREAAGLTQTAAAIIIGSTMRAWQDWESGARRCHPTMWRAWLHLAGIERIPFRAVSQK